MFLKYLTHAPRFDNDAHEKAWIIRTTVNTCKDRLRGAFARRSVPLEAAEHIPAPQRPESGILDVDQAQSLVFVDYPLNEKGMQEEREIAVIPLVP